MERVLATTGILAIIYAMAIITTAVAIIVAICSAQLSSASAPTVLCVWNRPCYLPCQDQRGPIAYMYWGCCTADKRCQEIYRRNAQGEASDRGVHTSHTELMKGNCSVWLPNAARLPHDYIRCVATLHNKEELPAYSYVDLDILCEYCIERHLVVIEVRSLRGARVDS